MSRYSLVIPVYLNAESITDLLDTCDSLSTQLNGELEVVFVVDGSPDRSYSLLANQLPKRSFAAKLLLLSRNFGSFAAIRAGLSAARGPFFAVMAADLQEPPELVLSFFRSLETEPYDVVCGTRSSRADPWLSRIASLLFWALYHRLVQPEIPTGGVDVFGCNLEFRDRLLSLGESNSSLVGLLFWMGYRRRIVPYSRLPRVHGRSAWTLKKKWKYLLDSIFGFTDLPIRLLILAGSVGLAFSCFFSCVVLVARISGLISVPGYATTVLIVSFFAALNSLGLGIIGSYVWRTFENTKGRPSAIVMEVREFHRSTALTGTDHD